MNYYDPNRNQYNSNRSAIDNQTWQITSMMQELKEKEQINMLKIEIAKATDSQVRKQLTVLLNEKLTEIEERKNRQESFILGILLISILLFVGFLAYFFFFRDTDTKTTNADPTPRNGAISSSSNEGKSEQLKQETKIDTTNLSNEQAIEWINAIARKWAELKGITAPFNVTKLDDSGLLSAERDKNMVYYSVQFQLPGDVFMVLRINSNGDLDVERNTFNRAANEPLKYTVISKEYMDTSLVENYINEAEKGNNQYSTSPQKQTFSQLSDDELSNTIYQWLLKYGADSEMKISNIDGERWVMAFKKPGPTDAKYASFAIDGNGQLFQLDYRGLKTPMDKPNRVLRASYVDELQSISPFP